MEMIPNSCSNFEKEEQSRMNHSIWYQTVLQGHCNQNKLVVASEQTHGPMKQNREPRNKPKSLKSINIWQRGQQCKMEQWYPIQQMVLGDLDSYQQKNETRSPTYTIHKNKFKVDKRFEYKLWHHKSPRENIDRKVSDITCSNIFTDMSPKPRDIK